MSEILYPSRLPSATTGDVAIVDIIMVAVSSASVPWERVPTTMPASISADQAYYWSVPWQRDIRESLDALAAADFQDFDDPVDPNDVARWLLAEDDG